MKESGITLTSLVITIIVMSILAGAGIAMGMESIANTRKVEFDTELKIIHSRVNELKEEFEISELNNLGSAIPGNLTSAVQQAVGSNDISGYRYFNREGLKSIDIVNIDREVVINFTTKDVVDIHGVNVNGDTIYRLDSWVNESYIDRNTVAPTFTLSKKIYGLNATISVENIVYGGNTRGGSISYCLMQGANEGEWHTTQNTTIPVSVSGIYKVKVTDSAGNVSQDSNNTIEITLTNKPKLDTGMTPVVYDETAQKWKVIDENSGNWYDYSSGEKKWANVMLQDGLEVNSDGTINPENMGSMFVWIPRYMYQIPSANYHTSTAGEINIKFLKGTTNIPTDEINVEIANASGGDNWNVHPAFCDGNKTDYANGEWDKDITGIWVAKFEASSNTPSASYGGGNNVSLDVKIIPSVGSWRRIIASNMYIVCKKMQSNNNIYELSSNCNIHLMKNSEWGMIAYLTQSKYGNMQTSSDSTSGVWNNSNSDEITGSAGSSRDASNESETSLYNQTNGLKASTTRNIYGIYDMAAGSSEYVAAYILNEDNDSNVVFFKENVEKREKQEYSIGAEEDSGNANYNQNTSIYGDAVYETSSNGNSSSLSWNSDGSSFPSQSLVFMLRGLYKVYSSAAGIFGFYTNNGNGDNDYSFRPVCIIE